MAGHQAPHSLLSELDPNDPQFPEKAALLSRQMQCELMETIAASKETQRGAGRSRSRTRQKDSDRFRWLVDVLVEPNHTAPPLLLCPKCNGEMLLFGIEPEGPKRDLYTFECEKCGHLEVRGVPIR